MLGQEGSILVQDGSREISSSANMAPRTDFHRFSIDVSLMLGWLVQALATKLRVPDRRHRPQGLYNKSSLVIVLPELMPFLFNVFEFLITCVPFCDRIVHSTTELCIALTSV